MRTLLTLVAARWGAGAGLFLPRAAHRFSVDSGQPWSDRCPGGHRITGAFAGLLHGAVYGLGMVVVRRAGRKSAIPLGPFMIGGAFTGLLLGAFAAA